MTTYTENCSRRIDENTIHAQESLGELILNWFRVQQLKISLKTERRQLLEMSDAMLKDMGITRAEAQAEAQSLEIPTTRLKSPQAGNC